MLPVFFILLLSGICEMKKLRILVAVLDNYDLTKKQADWVQQYGAEFESNKRQYAEKHGYDFFVGRENLTPDNHPVWSKFVYNLQKLDEGYDIILNIDADARIMNDEIKIEDLDAQLQSQCGDYSVAMAKDINGFNDGVYILKNTPITKQILTEAMKIKSDSSVPFIYAWYEQAGFAYIVGKNPAFLSQVCVPALSMFNSYTFNERNAGTVYKEGDFILHFVNHGKQVISHYMDKLVKKRKLTEY